MQTQEELMLAVLWSMGAEGARDNRRRPRVPMDYATGWVLDTEGGIRQEVRVIDVSAHGATLLFPAPVPAGHPFLLEFFQQFGEVPVLCHVAHCVREAEQFRVGASFVRFLEPGPARPGLTQHQLEPISVLEAPPPLPSASQPAPAEQAAIIEPVIQGRTEEMNPSQAS